jgi:hypothetical protein
MNQLKNDPEKRFTWAETCFLKRFYEELEEDELRENLVELI